MCGDFLTFFASTEIDVFVGGGGGGGAERTFILLLRVLYLSFNCICHHCCYHKRNGDTIGRPIVMVLLRASEATNERFVAHIGILRVSIGVDRPASSLRYFWNGFGGIHVPGSRERPLLVQQFVPLRELALSQATEPRASCCGSGLEHDFVDDLL